MTENRPTKPIAGTSDSTSSRAAIHRCWNCQHPIDQHSGEYEGWDKRSDDYDPVKQPGTGCKIQGCTCRRWFEVKS